MAYLHTTGEVIIHEGNWQQFVHPTVDGETKRCGTIPRDYNTHPRGCYAWASGTDFALIPSSEYVQRIADRTAAKAQLSDIRMTGNNGKPIPSRDQNGKGYCWAHSGTSAHLLLRAMMGQPYADLSAYSIACQIKNFADEGGWGAQGVDWQVQHGCATSTTWPQQSMSRSNLTDAMKADALQHVVTAQWADLSQAQYDRKLTWDQMITLLLSGNPCVTDFNWWGHSVCAADPVNGQSLYRACRSSSTHKLLTLAEFDAIWDVSNPVTAGLGLRIWNSWGDSWSQQGMGILTGSKAVPDSCVGLQSVKLAA